MAMSSGIPIVTDCCVETARRWRQALDESKAREKKVAERALHAEAAITRVRELHQPFVEVDWAEAPYCGTCACVREYGLTYEPWPCPTIRALDGESDA